MFMFVYLCTLCLMLSTFIELNWEGEIHMMSFDSIIICTAWHLHGLVRCLYFV